jgi:hypothetical protein
MDEFKNKVAKNKRDVRIVIALIIALSFIGLLVAAYVTIQGQDRAVEHYLKHERPDVVLAIEAYKTDNGHYPDFITNAVPRYYKGQQDRLFFLDRYDYKNFGTNFFLKDSNFSR